MILPSLIINQRIFVTHNVPDVVQRHNKNAHLLAIIIFFILTTYKEIAPNRISVRTNYCLNLLDIVGDI